MFTRKVLARIGALLAVSALLSLTITPIQAAGPQPNWQLPFQNGQTWRANAPHHDEGEKGTASTWGSIDFGPQSGASNRKVVAIAAGTVFKKTCSNGGWYMGVDHGNGWKSTYYHLSNVQSGLVGKKVAVGTYLGDASTATPCGGSASAPHVHLTIYKDGGFTNVNGYKFGNYKVITGAETYVGRWVNASNGSLAFNVPRPGYMVGSLKSTTAAPPALKSLTSTPRPSVSASNSAPSKLNASTGSWAPGPVALNRQWQVNGANIAGATGTSFTPTASHFGKKVRLKVTGSKAGYNSNTQYSIEFFIAKVVNKPAYQYVNIRQSANASSAYLGKINASKLVAVQCYATGSQVTGPYSKSKLWYKIPGGGWVAEALLETNSNNAVVPKC